MGCSVYPVWYLATSNTCVSYLCSWFYHLNTVHFPWISSVFFYINHQLYSSLFCRWLWVGLFLPNENEDFSSYMGLLCLLWHFKGQTTWSLFLGRFVRDIAYLPPQWLSAVSEGEAGQSQMLSQVEMSRQSAPVIWSVVMLIPSFVRMPFMG